MDHERESELKKFFLLILLSFTFTHLSWAQDDIESEVEEAEGPAVESEAEAPKVELKPADEKTLEAKKEIENTLPDDEDTEEEKIEKEIKEAESPAPSFESEPPKKAAQEPTKKEPVKTQAAEPQKAKELPKKQIVKEAEPKVTWERERETVSTDPNANRYPKDVPAFKKPPGPKEGGVVRVPHPDAARGLVRINRDGSYQYRTKSIGKSKAASLRITSMTPPKISSASGAITYESMYGTSALTGVLFDYEWQPFTGFGRLGMQAGIGFATTKAQGSFNSPNAAVGDTKVTQARETYTLYILPVSAFLSYRFEYVRRQWIVPFINGGGTYYGMYESRDDNKQNTFAGAAAVGGGGGVHISISRLDSSRSFILAEEYGIADMWFTLEARAMQGLSKETDFTGQSINAGVTVDF